MSIGRISELVASGTELLLRWDDGRSGRVDLAGLVEARAALAPLAGAEEFARATVSGDGWSVEWPCGIDFGAQQLRRWADEQAGEAMAAPAFRRWMERHHLTLDSASAALGLSRRMVAYYLSGEQPIPKTVLLATEGYDHRRAA
jgi:Protein of unknown function (DUF2442)